ncbi:hypothetical protein BJ165DRAFT_1615953 [Panaeolus papilionaceus]|nr:hypothetical protein BJ165DRAFT_1615953 [Panaeolus papilionaceus]
MSAVTQAYNRLNIDDDLGVVPITCDDVKGEQLWVYILMGPTGSGKSSYIQSLSPDHPLNISKDSFESVTQHVTPYRVLNLSTQQNHDFILLDTPGFLDTKMSERRITTMITETLDSLRKSASTVRPLIFYFQPITDIRMSGSKRGAMEMLRAFAQSFQVSGITIITTMWNNVTTPKQLEDANRRLDSLKHDIFAVLWPSLLLYNDIDVLMEGIPIYQGSSTMHIEVAKFEFSKDSALLILDTPYHGWNHIKDKSKNMDPQYDLLTYNNLLYRIKHTTSSYQHRGRQESRKYVFKQ